MYIENAWDIVAVGRITYEQYTKPILVDNIKNINITNDDDDDDDDDNNNNNNLCASVQSSNRTEIDLNTVVARAFVSAGFPISKEPSGLSHANGKRRPIQVTRQSNSVQGRRADS